MTETNITNWQGFIAKSGGLADAVREIDLFLEKLGFNDVEPKIKLMIENIASYFAEHKIINSEITQDSIDECYKMIR